MKDFLLTALLLILFLAILFAVFIFLLAIAKFIADMIAPWAGITFIVAVLFICFFSLVLGLSK